MFTGIVAALGTIMSVEQRGGDLRVTVAVGELPMDDVAIGDSIAVNGACLTAVTFDATHFVADVSKETVSLTASKQWVSGAKVNLEKALTPNTRMGGHMVTGHIDGVGEIKSIEIVEQSWKIDVQAPKTLAKYIARKGSVTVDGISLTVNSVSDSLFSLNIVPHTTAVTTVSTWKPGMVVNLEVDIIARYLERLLLGEKYGEEMPGGMTKAFLAENGFY